MTDIITKTFNIWTTSQTLKTLNRGFSANNQSLLGIIKLRELILELAVRGKLVLQDPHDEPASVLLKKIAQEERELIKSKQIKTPKKLPEINPDEVTFDLPKGWEFTRLNNIGEWGAGATPNRGNHEFYGGSIPWFKSGELVGKYISDSEEHVTELALKKASLRYNKVGDVLIAMYGATIGKTSILAVPATTNQAVCACTPFSGIYNVFLLTLLQAYKSRFIGMGAGGAQPNISREKIIATVVAIPPLAEQHRIVAKVDELMALCDQLEQQQNENNAAHETLVEILLGTLINAESSSVFEESWQRIAAHFDTLFKTEHSIDQLKQTILQLAVMGKLAPQNDKDEPASELLKKIAKEKARLVKEGVIKKQGPLPEIIDKEIPFVLPSGWEWARIGNCSLSNDYGLSEMTFEGIKGVPVLKMGDIQDGKVLLGGQKLVPPNVEGLPALLLNKWDLLYNRTNSAELVGKTGIYEGENNQYTFASYLIRIRCYEDCIFPKYLNFAMNEPSFRRTQIEPHLKQQCGQANVNGTILKNMIVPIPPLNEQHRIAAKIDELFALCDSLKELIKNAQNTQIQLAGAVVELALSNKMIEKQTYNINDLNYISY